MAGFGWDAAHSEWPYGFRLALRTELGRRLVRGWGIVPASVDERPSTAVVSESMRIVPASVDERLVANQLLEGAGAH